MKYLFIVIFFLSFTESFSQNQSFNELLKLYENGAEQEIESSLAKRFFNFTPDDNEVGFQTLSSRAIVFRNDNFIGLSAYSNCGAGGSCQIAYLVVFDMKGTIIDRLRNFEDKMSDCSFSDSRKCIYSSDSLIVIKDQKTTGDCIEDKTFTNKIKIECVRINNLGKFTTTNHYNIDTRRENYKVSSKLLTSSLLNGKTKEQLAVMRNEIFAAHGYKFKTTKWQEYFSNVKWYNPQFENVDSKLSFIERENIALILKYEKK